MSSLALLEPEIPYPFDVTGKNNVDFSFGVDGGCCCLSLCMDVVGVMVVMMVPFLNKR